MHLALFVKDFFIIEITKSSLANLEHANSSDNENNSFFERDNSVPIIPRLLIHGRAGFGQKHLGPAILHGLEEFPMYSIDLSSLLGDPTARTPAEAILSKVKEARRNSPSILVTKKMVFAINVDFQKLIFLSIPVPYIRKV